MQYSINSGSSWVNVGSSSDTNDCYTNNWYNYNSITYLATLATPKEGWSGNGKSTSGSCQGGFGSKKWVTAEHCLSTLTGQSSVIFRFTFGAGTSCNSYDGFAFDDVEILEAPKYPGKFGYTCVGVGKFNFIDSSTNCASNWSWNFGDPTSTTADTSTIQNPNHQYSKSGTYKVRLITSNSCSEDDTVFKTIIVPSVKSSFGYNCTGTNTLSFSDSTSGSPTSWSWNFGDVSSSSNTSTSQNPSHKFTKSGTYKVRLITHSSCSPMDTIIKTIIVTGVKSNFGYSCISNNTLSFTDSTSGSPTSWSWNFGDVSSSSNTSTLQTPSHKFTKSGTYTVTLISKGGCGIDSTIKTINIFGFTIITKPATCSNKNDGLATALVTGNNDKLYYQWSTNPIQKTDTAYGLKAGKYHVKISFSNNNCSANDTFTIYQPKPLVKSLFLQPSKCDTNDGFIIANTSGGTPPYNYLWHPSGIKSDT